ncbi:hypothetical protein Tco_0230525, partial [Tanacetum coccineum]
MVDMVLVSAGSTMILLVVILPAGCVVSAGSYGLCWVVSNHAGLNSVSAATTLHADDSDSAGSGSSKPTGSAIPMTGSAAFNTASGTVGATVTDSTVITT